MDRIEIYLLLVLQSCIYQEVMAMFTQISMISSSPYSNKDKDEKIRGYR